MDDHIHNVCHEACRFGRIYHAASANADPTPPRLDVCAFCTTQLPIGCKYSTHVEAWIMHRKERQTRGVQEITAQRTDCLHLLLSRSNETYHDTHVPVVPSMPDNTSSAVVANVKKVTFILPSSQEKYDVRHVSVIIFFFKVSCWRYRSSQVACKKSPYICSVGNPSPRPHRWAEGERG